MLWILFAASALIAYTATGLSIQLSLRRGVLDLPNVRSSHSRPIPRLGGIGIVLGSCLPMATYWLLGHLGLIDRALSNRDAGLILLAGGGMAVTGLYDDLRHLNPGTKLLIQLGLAALVVISGARIENVTIPLWRPLKLGMFSSPITILWLTGFSNVYNFMDGINGLAAGTGAVYGLFFFLFAWVQGNQALGATAVLLSGSCLGFLYHNFPQARTFMGDTGSLFLGMMFAFLAVRLAQQASNPASPAALLLVCSVYLYDSAFTLLRRLKHGENIFQAHRSHLYQRLAQAGLPHAMITYLYLLLHTLVGTLALIYILASEVVHLWILGFTSLVFLVFTLVVYRLEHRVAEVKVGSEGNPPSLLN
jgi:UDP-N-acetylmuramyl pentapeptide phosphotransferase/UDP-N-acetylglucosamine-1-phosphate transferase